MSKATKTEEKNSTVEEKTAEALQLAEAAELARMDALEKHEAIALELVEAIKADEDKEIKAKRRKAENVFKLMQEHEDKPCLWESIKRPGADVYIANHHELAKVFGWSRQTLVNYKNVGAFPEILSAIDNGKITKWSIAVHLGNTRNAIGVTKADAETLIAEAKGQTAREFEENCQAMRELREIETNGKWVTKRNMKPKVEACEKRIEEIKTEVSELYQKIADLNKEKTAKHEEMRSYQRRQISTETADSHRKKARGVRKRTRK
jgi:hypothetical protein